MQNLAGNVWLCHRLVYCNTFNTQRDQSLCHHSQLGTVQTSFRLLLWQFRSFKVQNQLRRTDVVVEWSALLVVFRRSRLQISTRRPAILTEDFCGFFSSSSQMLGWHLELRHYRFLSHSSQFIIHLSPFHSMLYSLELLEKRRSINYYHYIITIIICNNNNNRGTFGDSLPSWNLQASPKRRSWSTRLQDATSQKTVIVRD
jgi:hypothetical protein